MMIDSKMAQEARRVVQIITERGYKAYMVGGCVRDSLLGRIVQDIDIATSARPEEVAAIFPHTVPTGLQHGTVTVVMANVAFEVTTFRKESNYEQFRRPEHVEFIQDLHEDLGRRDFTFNAMAFDLNFQLIDPFGGQSDLLARRVRCVGNAEERFAEDALRMLRCIRFASELQCTIAYRTWRAIIIHREKLQHIAMERVRSELEKVIEGDDPDRGVGLLFRSGLLDYTKADIELRRDRCGYELAGLQRITPVEWRWTALFCLQGKNESEARRTMRALTFSRKLIDTISKHLRFHAHMTKVLAMFDPRSNSEHRQLEYEWKKAIVEFGKATGSGWFKLINSPLRPQLLSGEDKRINESLPCILRHGVEWSGSIAVESIHDLAIDGSDLIQTGYKPGPSIGSVLNTLLLETALGRIGNTRDSLLKRAQQLKTEG